MLHMGLREHLYSVSDERLQRALRHKVVRAVEKNWKQGDRIYYKQDRQGNRWRGPAVVIRRDGALVFINHQGSLPRVPANRIFSVEEADIGDAYQLDSVNQKWMIKGLIGMMLMTQVSSRIGFVPTSDDHETDEVAENVQEHTGTVPEEELKPEVEVKVMTSPEENAGRQPPKYI